MTTPKEQKLRKWFLIFLFFLIGAHLKAPTSYRTRLKMLKGAVSIKDVHSQGIYVQCGRLRTRGEGGFRCGCPHLLLQKSLDFSKFLVCPLGQGGRLSQCGNFTHKGVNFSRFCGFIFYGRPQRY